MRAGKIQNDLKQLNVVKALQRLNNDVGGTSLNTEPPAGHWKNLFSSAPQVHKERASQGVYLFGSPGCGKTFLLDLFYEFVPVAAKRRVHFNKFMLETHSLIHALNKEETPREERGRDPLPKVAQLLAKHYKFICFDEFQVTDIADAMIIKRLFTGLWDSGVVVFATSNRPPDDLYYNGLQRFLFLPFIKDLTEHCEVIDMDSHIDYRYSAQGAHITTFMHPDDDKNRELAMKLFFRVTGKQQGGNLTIPVMQGRTLLCSKTAQGCALFSFQELCERPLGAADYIALAQHFHHMIVLGVPTFSIFNRDVMRRFILLVDELYNRKVKLICTAAAAIGDLFAGEAVEFDEVFAFDRTLSRLTEMQTQEYMQLPHAAAT